ncbi:MAG: nuclear transport factor 2 family protein, partial [Acidobacteriota bacterium]|jgi:hypothetical protein|nr:nuclear transport factor 2 family protein [Acidobacteriota bacterium]
MKICKTTKILKTLFPVALLLFATACANTHTNTTAANSAALQELLDKTAIEELLIDYYSQLGTGGKGFGDYYLEDSVLDVNGTIATGREGIENLYKIAATGADSPSLRGGTFRMMLNNTRITVNGDSAKGDTIWVGIHSPEPTAMPVLIEHGRENDEFIKRDGRWYFKHRMITSDSGLTGIFVETFIKR